MRRKIVLYGILFFLPLFIGHVGSIFSTDTNNLFPQTVNPAKQQASIFFQLAWTLVYLLMGLASILIVRVGADKELKNKALQVFYFQLIVNFCWIFFFYRLDIQLYSFFWIVLLWGLIVYNLKLFYDISKNAFMLLFPYMVWFTYSSFRNLFIYLSS